jgi:hypothetical protein
VLLAVPADNIGGDSSRREDDATQRNAREDGMMRRSTRGMVKVKDVGSKQKENMVRVDK